ncbi:hypothetical protein [Cronobacter dublinensis]|uniref:hypothetical protein n=1 Tax=Cronobacter dublinensis TaxID=413497 RepID=UPI00124A2A00|nr:hypothetical protein [Cronobacter dublinensis]MDI6442242.1 hypothetical protein [Cronobacter dublinensis]NCH97920.1 hypothetical protein [Cronobacter dublinensis]
MAVSSAWALKKSCCYAVTPDSSGISTQRITGGQPLFDDIFALALTSFNGPLAGFSYEHLRDELTGLMSQALNIDYNTIALVTDSRNQKRW